MTINFSGLGGGHGTTGRILTAALAASLLWLGGCDGGTTGGDGTGGAGGGAGGSGTGGQPIEPDKPQPDPEPGQSDFVSADGRAGQAAPEDEEMGAPAAGDADDGAADRSVEEGDIYRVLGQGTILNLNSYRGLQIIDFNDVANPTVAGRVQVSGHPVELYTVGDTAIVLLNNWVGYWGAREELRFGRHEGGLVLAVDISNPQDPRILSQRRVPGYIRTSRLARQGDRASLYLVAQVWAQWGEDEDGEWQRLDQATTVVKSFDVSGGALRSRSQIDLGGYVADIQATPDHLIVARNDWDRRGADRPGSYVSLVDISSIDGEMTEGGEVVTQGIVRKKTDMNIYRDVLRVVSGSQWRGSDTNHIETWGIEDLSAPEPIDHETFGDGMQLFATLFLGTKAFFVTYLRVDPFHAFEITEDGDATEMSEFIVSGWNDWFRPVADDTRLIGIGMNDEGRSRTLSVSLYDITDLRNPEPLLDRADVEMEWSWSEASWDDRAFSVLENAVDVQSPDGAQEHGLVLLPFSGWSEGREYRSGVQIYTFSEHTLTRRGVMEHGSPVRRTFQATDEVTANLGEVSMRFFDAEDPDAPSLLGEVELAPNYTALLRFGDHAARVHSRGDYWWYRGRDAEQPSTLVQILPADADPDSAAPIAEFEIPAWATVQKVDDLLVALEQRRDYENRDEDGLSPLVTTLTVFDLSDPANPRARGTLETTELPYPSLGGSYGGYYGGGAVGDVDECWDCYGFRSGEAGLLASGRTLAFVGAESESEVVGTRRICETWVNEGCDWSEDEDGEQVGPERCINGWRTCSALEGEPQTCHGHFSVCTFDDEGGYRCEEATEEDLEGLRMEENCWEHEEQRWWTHHTVRTVDLSDPDAPRVAGAYDAPREDEAATAMVDGETLYLSFKRPFDVEGDGRPFVRYYIRPIDLGDADEPAPGAPINVPGALMAIDGDAAWFKDLLWGEAIVETAIARVELRDGRAFLQSRRRLEDQEVHQALLDGTGNVLLTHRTSWRIARDRWEENLLKLSVLDADSLDVRSESEIDHWAGLQAATAGRALFQVSGGLLVIDLDAPEQPVPQAYFPTRGWPSSVSVEGDDIIVPAGRYGIYRFSLDTRNLLPAPL
jgi:hypothetical protein